MRGHLKLYLRPAASAIAAVVCSLTVGSSLDAQTARDSVGVLIVETGGQQARTNSPITVRSQPELQLGVVDGDPAYLFSRVSGVAVLPGERILVVDGGSAEVRFYDRGGRLLDRRGRSGQGPGEFQSPVFLNTIEGDSLVIYDGSARRFTVLSGDGEGFRTHPGAIAGPGSARATSRASAAQVLMVVGGSVPPFNAQGPIVTTMLVRLADLALETVQTVATMPYTMVAERGPNSPLPTFVTAPFSISPAVAAGSDVFFMAASHEPAVLEYSWSGELQRIFRLVEPLNRVTDAELRAALELRTRNNPEVRPSYDDLESPAAAPTFQSLILDDEGWLWAQTYHVSPENAVTWLLFDRDGRGRGAVSMPKGLSVSTISRDYVAGVWRDEFDVEYVRLHRVDGRP